MIGQRDYSYDFILCGDGCTFPYLNWSVNGGDGIFPGIDFTGNGEEDNFYEWLIPTWENMRFIFMKGEYYAN